MKIIERLRRLFVPAHDRLRLQDMLSLRGARLPEAFGEAAARNMAQAVRRCERCQAKALCDVYLDGADPKAYRGFCANAGYVESLRDRARTLT